MGPMNTYLVSAALHYPAASGTDEGRKRVGGTVDTTQTVAVTKITRISIPRRHSSLVFPQGFWRV